eukprot:6101083-Amphidinium_carterae.2
MGLSHGGTSSSLIGGTLEAPWMMVAGVLDLSKEVWGSYSVMRALLSHLYSKPVAIQDVNVGTAPC